MGSYKKIPSIYLLKFNNAEYLTFMNHVLKLLPKPGEPENPDENPDILAIDDDETPVMGLTKEFLDTFEKDLLLMGDAVDESRTSQETENMDVYETNRDSLVTYITTRISRAGSLPLEAERDAGKWLYKVAKPYIGIARLPNAQETSKIKGLIIDLKKEENAPYVTTLGLDAYIDELEKTNNKYEELSQQRTVARVTNKKENGTDLRKRIDVYYDDLTTLVQSHNIVSPTAQSAQYVDDLNQLIKETETAYNQRKGAAAGKKPDEKPDENPDIL